MKKNEFFNMYLYLCLLGASAGIDKKSIMDGEALFNKVDFHIKNFQKKKKNDEVLPPKEHLKDKDGKTGLYKGKYKEAIDNLRDNNIAFTEWNTGFWAKEKNPNHWFDVDFGSGRYACIQELRENGHLCSIIAGIFLFSCVHF